MSHLELSFVTEATAGSHAIRWFTHSDFSHVDIITPSGRRLGARSDHGPGVRMRSPHYAKFTLDCRLRVECSAAQARGAYDWLDDQVGKPYDKYGLFASFLFDRPAAWWDEKAWWCSELATVFVAKAIGKPCRTPASRVSPNDCYIYAGCFAAP